MKGTSLETSPRPKVRVIGAVYLLYFLTTILAALLAQGIVVSNDAAATANNLRTHEIVFRSALAVDLVANAFYIALTVLFYGLFKPVNRTLSLLAAWLSLVGCAVQVFGGVFSSGALVVLGGAHYLGAFDTQQLQALALLLFKLHVQAVDIGLVFFAFYDLLIGYLIFRSGFLPRILGVLMVLAGGGWLTFLWPPLATALSRYVEPLGFLAEALLMLWLLVVGVDFPYT